ncbi:hypothetical protein IRP63_04970 [Clostridium botulinum]|uniref:Uncharacterized protein n=1 Tax=Clostridium botulinum C/D str. DC5 TaxID=1443128 RepID=A0A0A0IJ48_CLOBO|nr:hypothetical protein [Clostridium botulinum]KGM94386.1 hypothetical protein Z956_07665 [Clostridium botulinum D str. CCUG 7971]KGN00247.1 hypothetical protein Z955_04445 [Clostridium botulinum C/D str. DC5]KOC50184.1 hypothetical protein ADU89_14790 [Clostridium botulinum]KOC50640.1 hypothetical protein ADU88_01835 [Clostridium botulinum]KOC57648.1 hypothetical protein ADU90_04505 [Clostridium botulinum]
MIKMDINSKIMTYQSNSVTNCNTKKPSNTKNIERTYDYFELSSEGKSYNLAKVMEIHEKGFHKIPSKEESDYYWAARKSDPELDARLYERDKAEALKFIGQVQTILMKTSSGQKLTPDEEKMVKNDPNLQQAIQMRNF